MGLLVLAGWCRPAAACGACECETEPHAILNLIRDLPLNLEIPLLAVGNGKAPPRLEKVSDGTGVAATVTRVEGGGPYWRLKVARDLEPNTEYRIVGDVAGGQFTTGAARDEVAPTLGGIATMPGGNGGLCSSSVGALLTLSDADDGASFNVWVELEIDVASTAHVRYLDYQFGSIPLGHSAMGCFGGSELPELTSGSGYPMRARLHDAAGNVGEWQNTILTVQAEEPGGCGMPTPSAGASGSPGSANPGGGANGDPQDADGDDPARTSKGCGCSLSQREPDMWSGAALFGLALGLGARRRCSR